MKILRENGISRSKAASIVLGQFKGTNPRGEALTVESFRAFKKEIAKELVKYKKKDVYLQWYFPLIKYFRN